jgi:hypothetical protein
LTTDEEENKEEQVEEEGNLLQLRWSQLLEPRLVS